MTGSPARSVGIVANPLSGKDIRRLVGHASVVDNHEKVAIVRRVLLGLEAGGVREVLAMPDHFGIVERAAGGAVSKLRIRQVATPHTADERDTIAAVTAMDAADCACIVTLGGDGTNRAAAIASRRLPLLPLSTGTNNVFPSALEGTVAGLAAAALATGAVCVREVAPCCKVIEVRHDGALIGPALIDLAVLAPGFVGARALWQMEGLRRVLLTRTSVTATGMAALGGLLAAIDDRDDEGLAVQLGARGDRLRVAIAPGAFADLTVEQVERLSLGRVVAIDGPCLLAFDGERSLPLPAGARVMATLSRTGPPVVDAERCLRLAAARGFLHLPTGSNLEGAGV